MDDVTKSKKISNARDERRQQITSAALALVGAKSPLKFDPVHSNLCPVDIVMVAGAPWLKEALERDYGKDESGYKKIGGGANTPRMSYFFRSAANLIYFLKRQGLYVPRGGNPDPAPGMACFLDWDDRGRFNFAPDRSGIIVETKENSSIESIVLPVVKKVEGYEVYCVEKVVLKSNKKLDRAIIGYSDLP